MCCKQRFDLQRRVNDLDTANHLCGFLVDTSWKHMVESEGRVGLECEKHLNNPDELKFHTCRFKRQD